LVVTAGLVALVAILLTFAAMRIYQQMTNHVSHIEQKLDNLASRLESIEHAYTEHGRDLDAIRSEYAVHSATQEQDNANYAQAIKAASSGVSFEEVSETYGLREAEAKLLVSVYGNQ
jgi:predicted PurR-regulated permease PerM